ncbi:glycoside hydrolase 43 family protein [Pedobacter sp. ISL-68]|uniref:glycoside hydrolase family 43 protein n=1 Tax=unclassified Pedobacter TaxID=2628915 RepID=UPI001BED2D16|nr:MULTISPECIES: glycoside hydrolase 43 family protein [unclassified Pedobacter]MBT2561014.1 glycoside hydrolase 43 family protein [Pedobacter sp. ISL-64]MBT2590403.1 glycoside hydrolase 43 family protein [Pedobacter sp. ISL-68]
MKILQYSLIILLILGAHLAYGQDNLSKVWTADLGNGTYKNPVIHADYSDPDAIRAGEDYYMTASSFNCIPGLPILHSRDLVNWTLVNHALKLQEPVDVYDIPQHGKGVWAPSINYHKGEFRIYYPDPDYGIFMVRAKNPLGKWEKPVLILKGKGIIDPSVFFDDDGQTYLAVAWAASRAGVNSLLTVFKMNSDGTRVEDEGMHVFDGHGKNHTVEGPKFYKRNGYYYLFAPAGGVAAGWQLVMRSKNIYGPYEERKVMEQGKTAINGPHQGALVRTPKDEYWFLHFQDKGLYGRVVHLQPVNWKNDWPVIGSDGDGDGIGEPVSVYTKPSVSGTHAISAPSESDEFNGIEPGLQWQWHANKKIQWSAMIPKSGYLRLFAFPNPQINKGLWNVPNLLLQKFPAPTFTATTKLNYIIEWDTWQEKKTGLLIMGNDYSYLSVSKNEKGFQIAQVICKNAPNNGIEQILAQRPLKSGAVYLRAEVAQEGQVTFSYSEDGELYHKIGETFKAQPDKWIGAKIGIFCTSGSDVRTGGYADFDYFRITR